MAFRTLLQMCQNVADDVGLKRPPTIVGNSTTDARRMLRYAYMTGREIIKSGHPVLIKEASFSTVASQQDYDFEDDLSITDFDHFVVRTQWNQSETRRILGMGGREWQLYQSGQITLSIDKRFRLWKKSLKLSLEPAPTAVQTIQFEYVSTNFCESAANVEQSSFLADTDLPLIEDYLIEAGITWRILKRLGRAYADEEAEYRAMLDQRKGELIGRDLRLDAHSTTDANIPETGVGL